MNPKTQLKTTVQRRHDRDLRLRRAFGITLRAYTLLLAEQQYACAICGHKPKKGQRRLSVDHNHKTGQIRGLLCYLCNRGLRWFRDNEAFCGRAQDYLRYPPGTYLGTVPKR